MNIENILKNLPKNPGVYQFFNSAGKIIYIGKSINLKSRVNSYFNGKGKLNFAKQKMVKQIADIKYIVTTNETESLILETNLIKEYSPKYNVLMKDGKNHLYIKITNEIVPRIIKTRQKVGNGTYFGPYLSSNYVNNVLKLLQKMFGYRMCNINFNLDDNGNIILSNVGGTKIPCIYYYIKRCSGPCLKEEENIRIYKNRIEDIKDFLNGNTSKIKQNLEEEMKEKAKSLEFEEAGKIKELLISLNSMEQNQIVRDGVNGDFNVINYISKFEKFYIALIEIRDSKITGFYNFELENKLEEDENELLRAFIENDFIKNLESKKITYIVPFLIDFEGVDIKTEIPKIGTKKDLLDMAYRNIYEYAYKNHLDSLSTKGFTKKNMQNLLNILGYEEINKDIIFECNDISHISGNHTVASRSIIENGKTNPSKYRKFKIKTLEEQKINDFGSMREIMTRRLLEIKKTSYIPDLIVIDGGKGQLSSVIEVIDNFLKNEQLDENTKKLILSLQIVSIAKKEEELFIIRNGVFEKFLLDKESLELRMIQKIRDEAHRFAISFNRESRLKSQKKNILESLPGIGEKTRKKLLKKYGNIEKLKEVPKEELKQILNKTQIETLENHMII